MVLIPQATCLAFEELVLDHAHHAAFSFMMMIYEIRDPDGAVFMDEAQITRSFGRLQQIPGEASLGRR